ncbi:prephenate dehydrogenase [Carboxydocella sporoproducens DSM 16521]|uniref:Prephenate dehydrogenase n=3 Tax=Clostridiales Family XVI. Incertae Sedis TaxID=543347 RepID=A0A1T4RU16_9FIRM|nr:prephenate dehydrogenase [Carboxydocella thermautotrophica]SKA19248.1 prephenate dehydrogenase [Carboxydocella sporoproducens DSM 16521]
MKAMTVERKIAIIGLGLMGGSLASALSQNTSWQLRGWDIDPEVRKKAARLIPGIEIREELAEVVAVADLVVLAVPVRTAIQLVESVAASLARGAVLTDLCSTKGELERKIAACLPRGTAWIGGHPMAGSEKQGIVAASARLFQGATWFLCPGENCGPEHLELVREMVQAVGAKERLITARDHDRITARLSHLPHLVAGGLLHNVVCALGQEALRCAGPGLRDTTRIAGSPVPMWLDIFLTNREEILAAIDDLQVFLTTVKDALSNTDETRLSMLLEQARVYRQNMG